MSWVLSLSTVGALELTYVVREMVRMVREYGEYVEAWELHAYASLMVRLAMARHRKTSCTSWQGKPR